MVCTEDGKALPKSLFTGAAGGVAAGAKSSSKKFGTGLGAAGAAAAGVAWTGVFWAAGAGAVKEALTGSARLCCCWLDAGAGEENGSDAPKGSLESPKGSKLDCLFVAVAAGGASSNALNKEVAAEGFAAAGAGAGASANGSNPKPALEVVFVVENGDWKLPRGACAGVGAGIGAAAGLLWEDSSSLSSSP